MNIPGWRSAGEREIDFKTTFAFSNADFRKCIVSKNVWTIKVTAPYQPLVSKQHVRLSLHPEKTFWEEKYDCLSKTFLGDTGHTKMQRTQNEGGSVARR